MWHHSSVVQLGQGKEDYFNTDTNTHKGTEQWSCSEENTTLWSETVETEPVFDFERTRDLLRAFTVWKHAGLTWFPGGDSSTGGQRSSACTVVGQNCNMISSAGPQSRYSGCCFQSSRSHPVCCRLSLVLPPVADLRTYWLMRSEHHTVNKSQVLSRSATSFLWLLTSYPLRIPVVLSWWTESQDTWMSKAVSAVALILDGPTVGSGESGGAVWVEHIAYTLNWMGWFRVVAVVPPGVDIEYCRSSF